MALEPKRYSTAWMFGTLVIGAVCGVAIYYFLMPDPCKDCGPVAPQPGPVTMTGFFDGTSIATITNAPGAWGGRFYIARNAAGAISVLAGPIKEDGEHIPDESGTLQFMVFKSITADRTDMELLDEAHAVDAVKNASSTDKPGWSLDVRSDVLKRFLQVGGANGIGLQERSTTDESWSFDLAPVKLSGNVAYLEGTPADILMGAYPCPMHCPKDPGVYLHKR